jgi:hypothetical protein
MFEKPCPAQQVYILILLFTYTLTCCFKLYNIIICLIVWLFTALCENISLQSHLCICSYNHNTDFDCIFIKYSMYKVIYEICL